MLQAPKNIYEAMAQLEEVGCNVDKPFYAGRHAGHLTFTGHIRFSYKTYDDYNKSRKFDGPTHPDSRQDTSHLSSGWPWEKQWWIRDVCGALGGPNDGDGGATVVIYAEDLGYRLEDLKKHAREYNRLSREIKNIQIDSYKEYVIARRDDKKLKELDIEKSKIEEKIRKRECEIVAPIEKKREKERLSLIEQRVNEEEALGLFVHCTYDVIDIKEEK